MISNRIQRFTLKSLSFLMSTPTAQAAITILQYQLTAARVSRDRVNEAFMIYNKENFPYQWASVKITFGTAHLDRVLGEKAENLETAIAAYESALTVCTYKAFPSLL